MKQYLRLHNKTHRILWIAESKDRVPEDGFVKVYLINSRLQDYKETFVSKKGRQIFISQE